MKKRILPIGVLMLTVGLTGCGTGLTGGILDRLSSLPDIDGDLFPELPAPEGVADSVDEMIAISLTNEITRAEAEQLAGQAIPDIVDIEVRLSTTVTYANGVESTYTGRRNLSSFSIDFEAFCPEMITTTFQLVATAPVVGVVFDETMTFTALQAGLEGNADALFECGTIITIRAFLGDNGQPDVDISVAPQ